MTTPTDQELIREVAAYLSETNDSSFEVAQVIVPLITKREREKVLRELVELFAAPTLAYQRPIQSIKDFARKKGITLP